MDDEEKIAAAARELREAGWTVIEPEPARVIDGDGDVWMRMDDGLYYVIDTHTEAHTLAQIRTSYGIRSQA